MKHRELIAFAQRHGLSREALDELGAWIDARFISRDEAATSPTALDVRAVSPPRGVEVALARSEISTQPTLGAETDPEAIAPPPPEDPVLVDEDEVPTAPRRPGAMRAAEQTPQPPDAPPRRTPASPVQRQPRARLLTRGGPALGARYEDLGVLGAGGMGEVRRVRDHELGRVVAMKLIRQQLLAQPSLVARFIEEAQACSQLQHPGIIPVHDLGRLPDGRWYFTMDEIRGRTLSLIIRSVHEATREVGGWVATAEGWTLRRLISAFRRVCEAVGYAHNRGVVHRDLKPDNIMLGETGEVLVVDWGIAKVLEGEGEGEAPLEVEAEAAPPAVITDRSRGGEHPTQHGVVTGTPAYMPPEQAHGLHALIDARSDVYALGAILYEILCGAPPYQGPPMPVLVQLSAGPPPPLTARASLPLPDELVDACDRAMARAREARFPDAKALADAVGEWLEGSRRRERARALVKEAETLEQGARARRVQADALREQARGMLEQVQPWAEVSQKREGWLREGLASMLERDAALQTLTAQQHLQAALTYDLALPEAREALAERFARAHREAEMAQDSAAAEQAEQQLRDAAAHLPGGHPAQARLHAYLEGHGTLSLETAPTGARVWLARYEVEDRRLVPGEERSLGATPLTALTLPQGSYLLRIEHEGRASLRHPILIERLGAWCGTPPGASVARAVRLLEEGALSTREVYVPAGWFYSGAVTSREHVWVEGFVIERSPITNEQYLCFLNALVARGEVDAALACAPRRPTSQLRGEGALIYTRDAASGHFLAAEDTPWGADSPVVAIDWFSAKRFCDWRAEETGQPWRLPTALEWEKVARGVDARAYPWGNVVDPSWCCMRDSDLWHYGPTGVDRFPSDESPWGARGMAGNVSDWCEDRPHADVSASIEESRRVVCGGNWASSAGDCLAMRRGSAWVYARRYTLGFRPVRSV